MNLLKRIQISITEYDDEGAVVATSTSLTDYILQGGFPDSFNESLKGKGYFNFRVRKFNFNVLWDKFRLSHPTFSAIPKRKTNVQFFTLDDQGSVVNKLVDGFIDEVQLSGNPEDGEWKINIFPNALLLKDASIGSVIDEDDEEDQNYLFETRDAEGEPLGTWELKDIVQKAVDWVNERVTQCTFSVTDDSVPDGAPPTTNKKFGNVLFDGKLAGGWIQMWLLFKAAVSGTGARDYAKDMAYFLIKESGEAYFVQEKMQFGNYIWLNEGQWINWSQGALLNWTFSKYWTVAGYTFGFSLGHLRIPSDAEGFKVPGGDSYIPWIETTKDFYELKNGGIQFVETMQWWWHQSEPDHSHYGELWDVDTSAVVSKESTKLNAFLKEKGYDQEEWNQMNFRSFDLDGANTYCMFTMAPNTVVSKKGIDVFGKQIVLSFEGCFDDAYRIEAKNWNMTKLLQNLSKVSNRYFYVDEYNTIFLLPRSTDLDDPDNFGIGSATYQTNDILKYTQKKHNEDEYDMNVERLEYRTDGSVSRYGIWLRDAEYEGMRKFYSDYFERDRTEYKLELTSDSANTLDNTKLLQKLYINDGIEDKYYGHIIDLSRNFLENKITVTTEDYS